MTSPSPSKRIPELDGLRGIAISYVVLFHYFYWGRLTYDPSLGLLGHFAAGLQRLLAVGWSGVDLFFVLSGFLIGGILIDSRDSENYYTTFYMRRFYRILPIYYIWILGYGLLLWTIHHELRVPLAHPVEAWPDASLLWLFVFIQNYHYFSRASLGWYWISPTWSLAVEEQFYLIAPLVIRRLSNRALFLVMSAVVVAAPAARIWVHYHVPIDKVDLDLPYTLMPCRADALAIGVLIALLWRMQSFRKWLSGHGTVLYAFSGFFLSTFVILGFWSPDNFSLPMESFGYTFIAIFYGSLLVLVLEKRSSYVAALTRWSALRELGRVSYCVYLLHNGFAWAMREALHVWVIRPQWWAFVACDLLAATVVYMVARYSWRDIENPLIRQGHAYSY